MVNEREKLIAGQDNCRSRLLLKLQKLAGRTLTLMNEFLRKNSIHLRKRHSVVCLQQVLYQLENKTKVQSGGRFQWR